MNKSEWMPENPYTYKTGYDDTSLSIGFREGSNATARAILEYLIKECEYGLGKGLVELADTIYKARLIRLKSMLKQLEVSQ